MVVKQSKLLSFRLSASNASRWLLRSCNSAFGKAGKRGRTTLFEFLEQQNVAGSSGNSRAPQCRQGECVPTSKGADLLKDSRFHHGAGALLWAVALCMVVVLAL